MLSCLALTVSACGKAGRRAATAPTATSSATPRLGRFGSLRAAAASISRDCAATTASGLSPGTGEIGATGLGLWYPAAGGSPLVYTAATYVTDRRGTAVRTGAFSTQGVAVSLGKTASGAVALWPCQPPVVFYEPKGQLLMTLLARRPGQRKTVAAGTLSAFNFDPHGRPVTWDGTTVHESNAPGFVPLGLPGHGWRIDHVWPSPQNPRVLVVELERGACPAIRLYLAVPGARAKRLATSSCNGPDLVAWSPDGSKVLYATFGPGSSVHVTDLHSGMRRRLLGDVNLRNAIWSPNGRDIAYTFGTRVVRVATLDLTSGATRLLTPIHWTPTKPPYQPPDAQAIAWSPDGLSVAILYSEADGTATLLESVPASGGTPHVLLHLPQ